jgi:diguanylate cyclase (GGDEF)-like protein/PAS domain S-box-containing protein
MKNRPTPEAAFSSATFVRRLVTAIVLINLLVAGLVTLWLYESHKDYDERARITTRNLTQILEQSIEGTLAKFDLLLGTTAEEVEKQLLGGHIDAEALNRYLEHTRTLLPEADGLRLANERGDILYGTGVHGDKLKSIADRSYFIELRDQPELKTTISPPLLGMISNKWVLIPARRLQYPDGRFAGVVFASIKLKTFADFFASINVGAKGIVTLRDIRHGIVVRYPMSDSLVGQTALAPEVEQLIRQGDKAGTVKMLSPIDGVERMLSFRHLPNRSYLTLAGVATEDYLAEWHLEAKKAGALTLAFALMTMVSGWLLHGYGQRKAAAVDALAREEEKFRSIFHDAPVGHALNRMSDGSFLETNEVFCRITGYELGELNQLTYWQLTPEEYGPEEAEQLAALKATGHYGPYEKEYIRKDGRRIPVRLNGSLVKDRDGTPLIFSIVEDITEKKKSEELIWQQANFDALTGLPNRRMFQDRLEQEIKKAHRADLSLALIFLDLDRFKEVNDTLGHGMGDILLKEAAARLSLCVRESDTVARLGGDEFTIILSELPDLDGVERVAGDILRTLAEPFHLGNEQAYVSASLGITLYPTDASDIEALLKNADQAMYAAKQQGRNRFNYFTLSMQEAVHNRMRLATDLRRALADNQFRVAYQPIVELASGDIHKAEALIRWQHPSRGLVSPADFIPIAEDTGLITEIGDWMFSQAAQQASHWRKTHHPEFQVSVNVSPVQFYSEGNSFAVWFEFLRGLGLPGSCIAVEITEGLLLDGQSVVTDQLLEFRDAGMQVAIDDFGTGYSSLSYLKKFDIDYLKIDQSFVRNLSPDSEDMVLCEAIIVMAHKLGLKVIAEGVETDEQRQLLAGVGCDYGQGYLFSRPVAVEDFDAMLNALPA